MEDKKVAPASPESAPEYAGLVSEIEKLVVGIVHPPKLLDWFVGLASIVWGISLILVSTFTEEFKIGQYENWFFPLMVAAVAGGAGLILSEISGTLNVIWKRIFLSIPRISTVLLKILFGGIRIIGVGFITVGKPSPCRVSQAVEKLLRLIILR